MVRAQVKSKSRPFDRTPRSAEDEAQDPERAQELDKSRDSLGALLQEYLLTCKLEGKSRKTIHGYKARLSSFVRTVGGTLADLELSTIKGYIVHLQASKRFEGHPFVPTSDVCLSAMTVRNHVRVLTAFASLLQREDYLQDNVLAKLRVPKAPRRVMQTPSSEEIERILACLNVNTAGAAGTQP